MINIKANIIGDSIIMKIKEWNKLIKFLKNTENINIDIISENEKDQKE